MGKGAATRQAIVGRALMLATTDGFERLSIGGLAKEVGMSKSGLFAHFQSKEQLQLAVLTEASERFIADVIAPALKEARGEPRIVALFELWLPWEKAFPGGCPYQTAVVEFDDRSGPLHDYVVQTQRDWTETVETAARIAVAEGHFRPDLDVARFAFQFQAIALGFHRHRRLFGDGNEEALARAAFEDLLAGARAAR